MKVLVAFDNSPSGRKALNFTKKFDKICDLLVVLYVNPGMVRVASNVDTIVPEAVFNDQDKFVEEIKKATEELLGDRGLKYEFVKVEATGDEVAKKIYETATAREVDFIVTGTRKLTGLSKFILGSVSSELIKISQIPVMVVSPDDI
ncbi:MAG: universal stress protein [Cuniculiplasma sp.]